MILFGGYDGGRLSDTWEYDGASWKEITRTDSEGDGDPSARYSHSLTYDEARGVVVLFGGSTRMSLPDTWEYDGFSWKEITPTDPEGDGNPLSRGGHSLTYDAARGVVVCLGGIQMGDLWFWFLLVRHLGIRRHQLERNHPHRPRRRDGNPSARSNHSLTYDAARGVVILFGGRDALMNVANGQI